MRFGLSDKLPEILMLQHISRVPPREISKKFASYLLLEFWTGDIAAQSQKMRLVTEIKRRNKINLQSLEELIF